MAYTRRISRKILCQGDPAAVWRKHPRKVGDIKGNTDNWFELCQSGTVRQVKIAGLRRCSLQTHHEGEISSWKLTISCICICVRVCVCACVCACVCMFIYRMLLLAGAEYLISLIPDSAAKTVTKDNWNGNKKINFFDRASGIIILIIVSFERINRESR